MPLCGAQASDIGQGETVLDGVGLFQFALPFRKLGLCHWKVAFRLFQESVPVPARPAPVVLIRFPFILPSGLYSQFVVRGQQRRIFILVAGVRVRVSGHPVPESVPVNAGEYARQSVTITAQKQVG